MLRVCDAATRYVDQGGGKREGSFAIYFETWHANIKEFLERKKNNVKEERPLLQALGLRPLHSARRATAHGRSSALTRPNG
jgi:ribonucleoside-diphosphate reductase alpha chain